MAYDLNEYDKWRAGLPTMADLTTQRASAAGYGNDTQAYRTAMIRQAPHGQHWDEVKGQYAANPGLPLWQKIAMAAAFAPAGYAALAPLAAGAGGAATAGSLNSPLAGGVVPGVATSGLEAFPAAGGAAAGGAAAGSVLPATSTAFAGGAGSSVPTIAGSNLAGGTITGSGLSATPSLASRISTAGRFASNMAGERAGARLAEDQANQNYDRTQVEGARLNLQAPGYRLGNSLRGDLAANLQPVSFTGSGRDLRMTGGVSPALLSDNSRQLGQQVSRDALLSQMNGPAFTPTPRPKPNGFDKALNIGGTAAGLYGAYKGLF